MAEKNFNRDEAALILAKTFANMNGVIDETVILDVARNIRDGNKVILNDGSIDEGKKTYEFAPEHMGFFRQSAGSERGNPGDRPSPYADGLIFQTHSLKNGATLEELTGITTAYARFNNQFTNQEEVNPLRAVITLDPLSFAETLAFAKQNANKLDGVPPHDGTYATLVHHEKASPDKAWNEAKQNNPKDALLTGKQAGLALAMGIEKMTGKKSKNLLEDAKQIWMGTASNQPFIIDGKPSAYNYTLSSVDHVGVMSGPEGHAIDIPSSMTKRMTLVEAEDWLKRLQTHINSSGAGPKMEGKISFSASDMAKIVEDADKVYQNPKDQDHTHTVSELEKRLAKKAAASTEPQSPQKPAKTEEEQRKLPPAPDHPTRARTKGFSLEDLLNNLLGGIAEFFNSLFGGGQTQERNPTRQEPIASRTPAGNPRANGPITQLRLDTSDIKKLGEKTLDYIDQNHDNVLDKSEMANVVFANKEAIEEFKNLMNKHNVAYGADVNAGSGLAVANNDKTNDKAKEGGRG